MGVRRHVPEKRSRVDEEGGVGEGSGERQEVDCFQGLKGDRD